MDPFRGYPGKPAAGWFSPVRFTPGSDTARISVHVGSTRDRHRLIGMQRADRDRGFKTVPEDEK